MNWFANPISQVSAHVVIADDGTLAECVDPDLVAWHARSYNESWLGLEFVQPKRGDPISDAQYETGAWWVQKMAARFGFAPSAATLPEHFEIPPGIAEGKTDIEAPFSRARLLALVG